MIKTSVLMSIYRPDERYLSEQLESIAAQDRDDFEVIIYNDCPEDDTWEDFCREHCPGHPVRYVASERNRGYIKAFEYLVGLAEGEYVALCDQDDRWLPNRLSRGVELLDRGYLLVSCDRQVIDREGAVTEASWRASHSGDASVVWQTGDHFTAQAGFSCYSIGMATMLRTDVARSLVPFPTCTGHDKWLALGASAMGDCANIEEPLVQYRQHGGNQTGSLHGVSCKADWYRDRTRCAYELVEEFGKRFPNHPDLAEMRAFAQARLDGDVMGMWRHRWLAPQVASFEIALRFVPDWVFRTALRLWRGSSA